MSNAIIREGLHASLQELSDLVGIETVEALVRTFGGTRIYVPDALQAGHPINRMGEVHAARMVAKCGKSYLDIPRTLMSPAGRAHVIDRLTRNGLSQAEIARSLGCSHRTVSRAQNGHLLGSAHPMPRLARRVDPRQTDLEDWLAND